ncbi:hypothetical protein NKI95_19580 [Mesorhizobium sp. M0306]|uniref:hypothetical protein n=1 Tax=Mesorhizobium sp. M0306 TaxID=2956932 RepID=UPI003335DCE7
MNEPPYPFRDPKQGIREVYARIVRDFDRKAGAFAGLTYSSPWMLATEDWAERSGHSVEDLCEMISQKRISYFSKEPADPETVRIFEDFRNAAEEREETGYADLPTRLTPEMRKFTNYKELKAHTWRLWSSMGLDRSSHDYFLRDLSFRGTIEDAFGHEVLVVMKLKLGYGGPIRLDFSFPYYADDEPTSFGLGGLSGEALFHALRLPRHPELEWIAGKSKTSFDAVAITRAILTYLRPTIQ